MKTRIYFLDNLRTFLIFLVILLHAGLVYETVLENSWIVSDPNKNSSIGLIRMYLDMFVMFIIFFISGYFIDYSVKSKSTTKFLTSKFKRILLPWIVAVVTLIPAYKAIFLFSRGLPQEAWYSYFHIFNRVGGDPYFFADNPVQNWLWFLPVLFAFQVIYMVLSKSKVIPSGISLKYGVILTFIIGVSYSMIISSLDLVGWFHSGLFHFQNERIITYFMFFLLGAICYKVRVFDRDLSKKYFIISNVVLTLSMSLYTIVALNLFFNIVNPERNYYFISEFFDRLFYYIFLMLTVLSLIQILVYTFKKSLNKTSWITTQLNLNSYFVYIIHVVIIGLVSLALINIQLPTYVKLLIVVVLTFLISNILVYMYRVLLQKILSNSSIIILFLIAAAYLLANVYIEQNSQEIVNHSNIEQPVKDVTVRPGIHMAVIQGDCETVQYHISQGVDLNKQESSGGSTPLIIAGIFGRTYIAKELIDAGADVNFQNNDGSTPLHTAAFFCHPEILEYLLENGADRSLKNKSGSTALMSVSAPFSAVVGVYEYFNNTLGPLGLELDYQKIEEVRPEIARILSEGN